MIMPREPENPLLIEWTKELMDKAHGMTSKSYHTYKRAYDSLCNADIRFNHVSEAAQLPGIGIKLVTYFEEKMTKYCEENGLPVPQKPTKKRKKANSSNADEDTSTPVTARKRTYIPQYRSGGYGILLILLDYHEQGRGNLTKDQICREGQKYCNASFTRGGDSGTSYTAFSSCATLISNGYVYKHGSPARFQLTETGVEMAKKLRDVPNGNDASSSQPRAVIEVEEEEDEIDEDKLMYRNPPTARSSKRKKASTNEVMNRMMNLDDDAVNALDMSLYVSNPSEYSSISIDGRTSNNNDANNDEGSEGIDLQALADASRPQKKQRTSGGAKKGSRKSAAAKKTSTAALLESMLAGYDDRNNDLDISNYIMNPTSDQQISINGRTFQNKSTAASPGGATASSQSGLPYSSRLTVSASVPPSASASKITNSNHSAFASLVRAASDDNDYDTWGAFSTKYSTPSTSTILQADKKKKYPAAPKKKAPRKVDSDDEEMVDLVSSPELHPELGGLDNAFDSDDFGNEADTERDYFPMSQQLTKKINQDTFHYVYISTDGKQVRSMAQAAVMLIEEKGCLAYRIKFYSSQNDHAIYSYLTEVKEEEDGCSVGYLSELHTEAVAPGLPAMPILPLHREEPDDFWPETEKRTTPSSSQTRSIRNNYNERIFSSQQPSSSQPLSSSQQSQSRATQQDKIDYVALMENEKMIKLRPNDYEIILVLDSREIQIKTDRDYFQRKFAEKDVKCVTRSMELGDCIWIARKIGSNNQSDELYLDYIVERKRLDDLVTSIKDGRFIEQKTRLKRSGSTKVIYVVEEFNVEDAKRFGMQAIQTAMSSTQIIEGIYLKRTDNVDDTIDYLVSVTNLIKRMYGNTTLYAIPEHLITRQNYLDLKEACNNKMRNDIEKTAYLINYPLFGQLNTKNGSITLHEVYLRMLMTIRGVNAERALSLIKIYPTPHALLKAFHGKTVQEATNLVKDATQLHISRRRWGPQISKRLFQVWGSLNYEEPEDNGDDD